MLSLSYSIGFYWGYFAIMLICTLFAIIFAKKWYGWVFYGIGFIITYISLTGNQKKYDALGVPGATKDLWVAFSVTAIVGAVIVGFRFLKAKGFKLPKKEKNYYGKMNATNTSNSYKCEKCGIHLREDQARHHEGKAYCNSCYNSIKR